MQRLRDTLETQDPYRSSIKELADDLSTYAGRIASLDIYPVKALPGISVDEADLSPTGLSTHSGFHDRGAMLVQWDETLGRFERFSQRNAASLARIRAKIIDNAMRILQYSDGNDRVQLPSEYFTYQSGERVRARMYDDVFIEGALEPATDALTQFIRNHLRALHTYTPRDLDGIRVLRSHTQVKREVPLTHSGGSTAHTNFADVGQHLLVNQSTVDDYLNRYIDPRVPIAAFRPNITVNGWSANMEDFVAKAVISNGNRQIDMEFGVPSERCAVTMVDIATGTLRKDKEPLRSLKKLRPLREGKPTLGINIAHDEHNTYGSIRIGNPIIAIAEKMVEDISNNSKALVQ